VYLPEHNRRFSVPTAREGDLHRKLPEGKELKKILCIRTKRAVRNDGVIRHNRRFYQIEGILPRRVKSVIVEDRLDGSMHVRNNGAYLKWSEIDFKSSWKGSYPKGANHNKAKKGLYSSKGPSMETMENRNLFSVLTLLTKREKVAKRKKNYHYQQDISKELKIGHF
jgi:hypothetical protein